MNCDFLGCTGVRRLLSLEARFYQKADLVPIYVDAKMWDWMDTESATSQLAKQGIRKSDRLVMVNIGRRSSQKGWVWDTGTFADFANGGPTQAKVRENCGGTLYQWFRLPERNYVKPSLRCRLANKGYRLLGFSPALFQPSAKVPAMISALAKELVGLGWMLNYRDQLGEISLFDTRLRGETAEAWRHFVRLNVSGEALVLYSLSEAAKRLQTLTEIIQAGLELSHVHHDAPQVMHLLQLKLQEVQQAQLAAELAYNSCVLGAREQQDRCKTPKHRIVELFSFSDSYRVGRRRKSIPGFAREFSRLVSLLISRYELDPDVVDVVACLGAMQKEARELTTRAKLAKRKAPAFAEAEFCSITRRAFELDQQLKTALTELLLKGNSQCRLLVLAARFEAEELSTFLCVETWHKALAGEMARASSLLQAVLKRTAELENSVSV